MQIVCGEQHRAEQSHVGATSEEKGGVAEGGYRITAKHYRLLEARCQNNQDQRNGNRDPASE